MGRWCGLSFTSYLPDDITVLETLEAIKLRGGHREPTAIVIASDERTRASLWSADHRRINRRLVWAEAGTTHM